MFQGWIIFSLQPNTLAYCISCAVLYTHSQLMGPQYQQRPENYFQRSIQFIWVEGPQPTNLCPFVLFLSKVPPPNLRKKHSQQLRTQKARNSKNNGFLQKIHNRSEKEQRNQTQKHTQEEKQNYQHHERKHRKD